MSEGSNVKYLLMFLWFSLLLFLLAELAVRRLLLLTEGELHESRVPETLWTEKKTNTVDVICLWYKSVSFLIQQSIKAILKDNHFNTMALILEFKPQAFIGRNIHLQPL